MSAPEIEIDQILRHAPDVLVGRGDELAMLDDAWQRACDGSSDRPRVLTFVAVGGEGKTSLVAHWLTTLAHRDWLGCEAVFAWSFYNQGVQGAAAGSSDLFLVNALRFFGDSETADSALGAYEKAKRLARLVAARRAILVLDGLEPLQYPPNSPLAGQFTDAGIAALLRGLATANTGLCLATTRQTVADLAGFRATTAPEPHLRQLPPAAGVDLLRRLEVRGRSTELGALVERLDGHALALTLVGTFLRDAHGGDVHAAATMNLADADRNVLDGHAFRAMAAYEEWFASAGDEGASALAVLRLVGLFDRPASAGCVGALLAAPVIEGLTGPVVGLDGAGLNMVLARLERARLVSVTRAGAGLVAVDAHPLVREYIASRLRQVAPEAWRAAHRRVYDHLVTATVEGDRPSLEDLQPLYQAVIHGCHADHHQAACDDVFRDRIRRRDEHYSTNMLGAFGPDVAVLAGFFTTPWTTPHPALTPAAQSWILGVAGLGLRALGRLGDATQPLTLAYEHLVRLGDDHNASIAAENLCGLVALAGDLTVAQRWATTAIGHADTTTDQFDQMTSRVCQGDVWFQQGDTGRARAGFTDAETRQHRDEPDEPFLYSLRGFLWCSVLLAEVELAAWTPIVGPADLEAVCAEVTERAEHSLTIARREGWLLDIGLDQLTLARVGLYRAVLTGTTPDPHDADTAVDALRHAGQRDYLVYGLLTRAWVQAVCHGPVAAIEDLDEAWEIAELGGMRLHLADIHLHRARLCQTLTDYPPAWGTPTTDLDTAARLIDECGYHRRDPFLAAARRIVAEFGVSARPGGAPSTAAPDLAVDRARAAPTRESEASVTNVLISYSHDSDEHRAWVLGLSERLRSDGITCFIDQYVNGSPAEGWPRWMLDRLDEADFVICVCTDTYYRRFRGKEVPGVGKGVTWEGFVMTNELYDAHAHNTKFIPALVSGADGRFIPEPLRAATFYVLDSSGQYQHLVDHLNGVAGIEPREVSAQSPTVRPTAAPLVFADEVAASPSGTGRIEPSAISPSPAASGADPDRPAVPGPTSAASKSATSGSLAIWLEKREFLLTELATASGVQKFALQKELRDAEAMIAKLQGGSG